MRSPKRIVMAMAGTAFLALVSVGPPTWSATPDAVVNVSLAAGYQGQVDVAVDPAHPDALVVVGADDTGSPPAIDSESWGRLRLQATRLLQRVAGGHLSLRSAALTIDSLKRERSPPRSQAQGIGSGAVARRLTSAKRKSRAS